MDLPERDEFALRRFSTAWNRLARLNALAADPDYMQGLFANGRYLRLAAAIARASEAVDANLHQIRDHVLRAARVSRLH